MEPGIFREVPELLTFKLSLSQVLSVSSALGLIRLHPAILMYVELRLVDGDDLFQIMKGVLSPHQAFIQTELRFSIMKHDEGITVHDSSPQWMHFLYDELNRKPTRSSLIQDATARFCSTSFWIP